MTKKSEFNSWQGQEISFFCITSVPTMGPTQPPIQWVSGLFLLGVKQQGHKACDPLLSSAKVKDEIVLLLPYTSLSLGS
jgi:hypothetical protein